MLASHCLPPWLLLGLSTGLLVLLGFLDLRGLRALLTLLDLLGLLASLCLPPSRFASALALLRYLLACFACPLRDLFARFAFYVTCLLRIVCRFVRLLALLGFLKLLGSLA